MEPTAKPFRAEAENKVVVIDGEGGCAAVMTADDALESAYQLLDASLTAMRQTKSEEIAKRDPS